MYDELQKMYRQIKKLEDLIGRNEKKLDQRHVSSIIEDLDLIRSDIGQTMDYLFDNRLNQYLNDILK